MATFATAAVAAEYAAGAPARAATPNPPKAQQRACVPFPTGLTAFGKDGWRVPVGGGRSLYVFGHGVCITTTEEDALKVQACRGTKRAAGSDAEEEPADAAEAKRQRKAKRLLRQLPTVQDLLDAGDAAKLQRIATAAAAAGTAADPLVIEDDEAPASPAAPARSLDSQQELDRAAAVRAAALESQWDAEEEGTATLQRAAPRPRKTVTYRDLVAAQQQEREAALDAREAALEDAEIDQAVQMEEGRGRISRVMDTLTSLQDDAAFTAAVRTCGEVGARQAVLAALSGDEAEAAAEFFSGDDEAADKAAAEVFSDEERGEWEGDEEDRSAF
jgi:hypothetical protein